MAKKDNNCFKGYGVKSTCAYIFYKRLMTKAPISYREVLSWYKVIGVFKNDDYGHYKDGFEEYYEKKGKNLKIIDDKTILNTENIQIKKGCSEVQKKLKKKDNDCIKILQKKPFYIYQYVGTDTNPLAEEIFAAEEDKAKEGLEKFVKFCKSSIGFLPDGWLSSFFDNANILSNASNDIINSSITQDLKNIELLSYLYKAITDKKVICFSYHPFDMDREETITFHPQFLKEYNQRWFLFGKAKDKGIYPYNIALDRIQGGIRPMEEDKYIPAEPNFYHDYFENIVGVTHEKDSRIEHIVIRTLTKYQHGLIITKPFHHSQKETKPFNKHKDGTYGEISLKVLPNKELIGRILTFGEKIEVIKPLPLRNRIHDILNKQIKLYEK